MSYFIKCQWLLSLGTDFKWLALRLGLGILCFKRHNEQRAKSKGESREKGRATLDDRSESMKGMDEMEALCKKLSFPSSNNQLKWHGSKNDLLRFLTLHLEVQPNQFRANDNGSCTVFKIQNITCNFYHKARTLQIQGKEDADKLRNDLNDLTSIRSHPVSETPNALQENEDKDVQLREEISSGLISPSDGPSTTCGNRSERDVVKSAVLSTEDDLRKAENFIDNAYIEIILDSNESNYSNPVKGSKADFDHQLVQLSLLLKGVLNEVNDLKGLMQQYWRQTMK